MTRLILPEPPAELKQLSHRLCRKIDAVLQESNALPFSRFMEMALYEPGLGYYAAGLHKLGASGDFVTAPELGALFAACLAQQAGELGRALGSYDILEIGAGTGNLAADILLELDESALPDRYLVLERSADLRRVQKQTLADRAPHLLKRVHWLDHPPVDRWQGLLIANEVIDALAVERFQVTDGHVEQLCVKRAGERYDWLTAPAPPSLESAVRNLEDELGKPFADGYRSELQLTLPAWLAAVTETLERGLALFIDYGYPRSEYYLPERSDGTLMCHYRHRAHVDVFFWPGLQDITAWVDFTALAEAADHCGLDVEGYASQTLYLLGCGLDRVLADKVAQSDDDGLELSAEARQLTLPGSMGEKFQVMGLGRGLQDTPAGFSLQDLRYRL